MSVVRDEPLLIVEDESRSWDGPPRRTRFFLRFCRNRAALVSLCFLGLLVLVAIAAPLLAPYNPNEQNLVLRLHEMSWSHWLGNDEFGRDVLSRLIYGTRVSLLAALEAVAIGAGVGATLGLLAGGVGRWVDGIINYVMTALQSVPALFLALTVVAVLGVGLGNAMLAVGIIFIPNFFRIARAAAQDVRHETFIEASDALGATPVRTMVRHVLPNALSPVVVQLSFALGAAVTAEAALSYLGLGVRPPTASWGSMLASASTDILLAPFLVWAPGIMITLTVLAFTLVGDGLRSALGVVSQSSEN